MDVQQFSWKMAKSEQDIVWKARLVVNQVAALTEPALLKNALFSMNDFNS